MGLMLSIDRDVSTNATFRAELSGKFIDLTNNQAVAAMEQIRV